MMTTNFELIPLRPREKKKKPPLFKFSPFSRKQKKVLTWWHPNSPHVDKDGIICDGAVRAGKTVVMSLSYVMWANETFDDQFFGLSGKTIGSLRRNLVTPLKRMLRSRGYWVKEHRFDNMLTVKRGGRTNYFYMFGGKDESSQDLIQGVTLAGMFFDEVALMPESFVNQATARCSVEGAKLWFNCNPGSPYHWFKEQYLDKLEEKNMIHLHFTMEDNLSLSERVKDRYRRMYSGVFYDRYIRGLWVLAEGLVFDQFNKDQHVVPTVPRPYREFYVSIDYGTQNPTVFGLWGNHAGRWYKVREYHYEGRKQKRQRTDVQYSADLKRFLSAEERRRLRGVVVDPSAASFIAQITQDGFPVIPARNDVLDGIRNMATALQEGMILYNDCCDETFREFGSYVWDQKAAQRGEDKPVKENDHHMDSDRYFVHTIIFAPRAGVSGSRAW